VKGAAAKARPCRQGSLAWSIAWPHGFRPRSMPGFSPLRSRPSTREDCTLHEVCSFPNPVADLRQKRRTNELYGPASRRSFRALGQAYVATSGTVCSMVAHFMKCAIFVVTAPGAPCRKPRAVTEQPRRPASRPADIASVGRITSGGEVSAKRSGGRRGRGSFAGTARQVRTATKAVCTAQRSCVPLFPCDCTLHEACNSHIDGTGCSLPEAASIDRTGASSSGQPTGAHCIRRTDHKLRA
jgi:hypothetical protein